MHIGWLRLLLTPVVWFDRLVVNAAVRRRVGVLMDAHLSMPIMPIIPSRYKSSGFVHGVTGRKLLNLLAVLLRPCA